jgi:UDP-glucuronate 4-epimerase
MDPDPSSSESPYRIFNIGSSSPVRLMTYIETLEKCLGSKAIKNFLPIQQGDVPASNADTSELRTAIGYAPSTPVGEGIRRFVDWYRSYYLRSV